MIDDSSCFFAGCVVTTTGLLQRNRSLAAAMVEAKGGVFRENLSTDCTHVVVGVNYGDKAEVARNTRKFVVTWEWLNECYRTGKRVPERTFETLAGEGHQRMAVQLQPRDQQQMGMQVTEEPHDCHGRVEVDVETDGEQCTMMEGLVFAVSIPDEKTRRDVETDLSSLGAIVEDYSHSCTHVMCQYQDELYTQAVEEGKVAVSTVWLDHCLEEKRLLSPSSRALFRPVQSMEGIPECICFRIAVSGFVGHIRSYLKDAITVIGAEYTGTLSHHNTHLVFLEPTGAKYAKAKEWGVRVVTPEWLETVIRDWKYVPEDAFGGTAISTPGAEKKKTDYEMMAEVKSDVQFGDVIMADKSSSHSANIITTSPLTSRTGRKSENSDGDVWKHCSMTSTGLPANILQVESVGETTGHEKNIPHSKRRRISRSSDDSCGPDMDGTQRKAIQVDHAAPVRLESSDRITSDEDEPCQRHGKERYFLFSGFTRDEERELGAVIVGLGGKLAVTGDSHHYAECTTHIIFKELKRVEKFLCGCAAGVWILKPEYVQASNRARKLVCEDEFEWHGTEMVRNLWLGAARRWRLRREQLGERAFHGQKFYIHSDVSPPAALLKTIVIAGGGTLVSESEMLHSHFIVANKMLKLPPESQDVAVVTGSFIVDFLSAEQQVLPREYFPKNSSRQDKR